MFPPLEDEFQDILGKAMSGLGLSLEQLARQSEVALKNIQQLLEGTLTSDQDLTDISKVLGLHPQALLAIAHHNYHPQVTPPHEDFLMTTTSFDGMDVNAYLVSDSLTQKAVLFDTGADSRPLSQRVQDKGLTVEAILLTHSHGDHIFDIEALKRATQAPAFIGQREPIPEATCFHPGKTFTVGGLRIETRLTHGHSPGAITYFIQGHPAGPLAIVGDALFAGSMGGARMSYTEALATNKKEIFTLPDETLLCPGHGPLTRVCLEKRHNPFFCKETPCLK